MELERIAVTQATRRIEDGQKELPSIRPWIHSFIRLDSRPREEEASPFIISQLDARAQVGSLADVVGGYTVHLHRQRRRGGESREATIERGARSTFPSTSPSVRHADEHVIEAAAAEMAAPL